MNGAGAARGPLPRGRRQGPGMVCPEDMSGSAKPVDGSSEPHAVINLMLDLDGGITVLTGAADIGQGPATLLTQVVAEVLLLPMVRVRVVATDSALTPKGNGSHSSRVSLMVGNAALRVAEALERVLLDAAARRLAVPADDNTAQALAKLLRKPVAPMRSTVSSSKHRRRRLVAAAAAGLLQALTTR